MLRGKKQLKETVPEEAHKLNLTRQIQLLT